MATEPNTGLTWQEAGSLTTDALHNQVIDFVSIWVNCSVLAVGQAAPAGTEVEGDRYIVGTGTGPFAMHDDDLAIRRGGTWQFHAPPAAGVPIIKNLDDGTDWECVAGVWAEKAGGGGGGGGTSADPVTALANSAGTVTVDCSLGKSFTLTLAANVTTLTLTNLAGAGFATEIEIEIKQDGTGGWTLALPASFKALGGSDTAIASAANAVTVLSAKTFDSGTAWRYAMQESA